MTTWNRLFRQQEFLWRTAPLALRVMNVGGLRDAHSIQISDNTMYWVFGSYSILRYLDSQETLPLSFDNRTMTNIMVVQDEYNVRQYQWANTVAIGNRLHFRPRRMPGENVSPSMQTCLSSQACWRGLRFSTKNKTPSLNSLCRICRPLESS